MKELLIGSHVPLTKEKDYLIGSAKTMVEQAANTFMIFTGPPQNSKRTPTTEFNIKQMEEILEENNVSPQHLVVHAPYIVNLANQFNEENWKFSVDFFSQEVRRAEEMNINLVVLHPGSSLGGIKEVSLNQIIKALNQVIKNSTRATIVLETMSGKKNELGARLEELAYIINNVAQPERIGICLDTCHLHDAGYDLSKWEEFKEKLDQIVGLDKVKVIHLNDSQNKCGSHLDRHENLGYGEIGFQNLMNIAWDPVFKNVPKILETPLKKTKSAHHIEINAIKERNFIEFEKFEL